MEILASNGQSMTNEVGNVGLPEICQVEDGLLTTGHTTFGADNIVESSGVYLEDESMKVYVKKRAVDDETTDLHVPSKKPAVRSSSDAFIAEIDLAPVSSEAMIIDATDEVTEARGPGSPSTIRYFEQVSGAFFTCSIVSCLPEMSNPISTEAPNICEAVLDTLNLQKPVVTLSSVDCGIHTVNYEGDLITLKSGRTEVKDAKAGISDSHGVVTEKNVVKDTLILQNTFRNGQIDFEAGEQVISNVVRVEATDVVLGTKKYMPSSVGSDKLLSSRLSEVDSEKIDGELHVSGTSPFSVDEVSASEAQMTPPLLGSKTATACPLEELAAASGALQCETSEEGVEGENEINEVDELQVGKADAAKVLELKMVEVIMQNPESESSVSGIDDKLDLPSDYSSSVRGHENENRGKDILNSLSEDDSFSELFQPVVQLPEHLVGAKGFLGATFDVEGLSNGQVPGDLQQGSHAITQPLRSKIHEDTRSLHVPSNRGLYHSQQSSGDEGDGRMDRQLRMRLKLPGEIPLKSSPGLAVGTGIPVREILFKEAPASAKLLLTSGLLDGHRVRYLGRGGHIMLTGVIQEGGVRCDCTACKGVQVVNVSAFEKHAGSSARHPSDFIFLENGKCIKDILEIGWNANKEKKNIINVLNSAIGEVEGELVQINGREHPLIQNQLVEKKSRLSLDSKPRVPLDAKLRMSLDSKRRLLPDIKFKSFSEIKARGNGGRVPLPRERNVREKEKEKETVSPPVLSRETSGPNLHKALFLPGGLEDNTELGYYVKGQKFLIGVKKGVGILCSCCEQLISCSLFEQHAGWGSRRNPYTSIYLADGRSLHDAAQSLVVKQTVKQDGLNSSMIEHLDQCVECGDSVDLQLCTGCPNAYHQDCLGSGDPPTGGFHCPDCQEQRFGGSKDRRRSMAKRRSKGFAKTLLTKNLVTTRCARLLQTVPEAASIGGCVFCKSGDFVKSGFGPMTTMLCDQCEREYHVGCLKKHGLEDLKELPEGEWFCGQDCKHIHSILSLLVANGPEPLADSIISKVLKNRQQLDKSNEYGESVSGGFAWQLLHGRGGDPANGKTLAEALEIFSAVEGDRTHLGAAYEESDVVVTYMGAILRVYSNECFDPIADGISGGDLIPLMVYRRSIRDQDFGGIYCVVLKQFGKVVSAALIRVFGRRLAELSLLATNPTHQRQGHCKALLLSIERLLGVLRVERLALPAAEGAEDIWLNKFGFRFMSEEQTKDFHRDLNIMIFTGSFMLEKEIAPLEITGSA